MKKNYIIVALVAILGLFASFVGFYTMNLLFSDVGNFFEGPHDLLIIATLPGFMFTLETMVVLIGLVRYIRKPEYVKSMVKVHSIISAIFSLVGFVTSIVSGLVIYKSFIRPYPYPGYLIVSLAIHAIILVCSLFVRLVCVNKMPDDEQKRKTSFVYVLYTTAVSLFLLLAIFRFGTLLWAPSYAHIRTLYKTWPFYVWQIIPIAYLFLYVLVFAGLFKNHKVSLLVCSIVLLLATTGFSIYTFIIGATDQQFISVISPALPLERLATKPLETILTAVVTIGFGVYSMVYSIIETKKSK